MTKMSVEIGLRVTEPLPSGQFSHLYPHLFSNLSVAPQNALREPISPLELNRPRIQRSHGSLSFLPATTHASDPIMEKTPPLPPLPPPPPRRFIERPPIYISPFRSVRKMREPFQLMLPSSPSLESRPPMLKEPRALQSPIPLRSLRSCRSDQNLVADAFGSFGLLPSPSLSESRLPRRRNTFSPKEPGQNPIAEAPSHRCSCLPHSNRCELCVVSSYEGDNSILDKSQFGSDRSSSLSIESKAADGMSSLSLKTISSKTESLPKEVQGFKESQQTSHVVLDIPVIPSELSTLLPAVPGISRAPDVVEMPSKDIEWASDNLSYCESWLQNVPAGAPERNDDQSSDPIRRKCQMIEPTRKPVDLRIDAEAANKSMAFAVAPKSKPKLVDISRRLSAGTSSSLHIQPTPPWQRPSTPDRTYEVSAFSPDTPMDIPDGGYVPRQSSNGTRLDCIAVDDGLTICDHSNLPNADNIPPKRVLKDKPVSSSRVTITSTSSDGSRTQRQGVSPSVSPRQIDETLQKWWDYEWCLDQLEMSIKEFPKTMLQLTSPVIMFLRQSHENVLIHPFKKIFPNATEKLVDHLCAALLAHHYLVTMAATHHRKRSSSQAPILSRLDSVPEKARVTLGIHFPASSMSNIADQLLGSKSLQLRKGLNRILDKLITNLCGRSDETLKASLMVLIQVLESQ